MGLKAIGIMFMLLGLLFWRYENVNEQRLSAQVTAVTAMAELNGLKDNIATAQKLNAEFNIERAGHENDLGKATAEINKYRQQADALALADPKTFGDDYHMRITRIMCQFSAQGDYAAEQGCISTAAKTIAASVNTITITPAIAETYQELCEEGQKDFCEWSLTGYTPQGGLNHLTDLQAIVSHSIEQTRTIDYLYKIIEKKNKPPPEWFIICVTLALA